MTKIHQKEIYTMKEFAKILGINTRTAYRYCKTTELPAKKILGKWFIPKQAVDRFLKGIDW